MTTPAVRPIDLWVVAQTIWGEARGEPFDGKVGVAWVLLNRQTLHLRWKDRTLAAICHAPSQFSCWLPTDPNARKVAQITLADPAFVDCMEVALSVLGGRRPSPVDGATHYYADTIPAPAWAHGHTPVAHIGHHLFFAGVA